MGGEKKKSKEEKKGGKAVKSYSSKVSKVATKAGTESGDARENHPTTQKLLVLNEALDLSAATDKAASSAPAAPADDAAPPASPSAAPSQPSLILQGTNKVASKKGQRVTKLNFDQVDTMCVEHVGKDPEKSNLVSAKIR